VLDERVERVGVDVIVQDDTRLGGERIGGDAGEVRERLDDRAARGSVGTAVGDADRSGNRAGVGSACRDTAHTGPNSAPVYKLSAPVIKPDNADQSVGADRPRPERNG